MADGGEEEASRTADLESILGMFCAQGARERMLRWHYRSRHESLITVSNHEFYDNRLVVFPSPDAGKVDTGLVFRHNPDASYQRRGINTAEAKTVALAVMKHAREVPEFTLGATAASATSRRAASKTRSTSCAAAIPRTRSSSPPTPRSRSSSRTWRTCRETNGT